MNRGYAFGFLIILLIVILGLYVAITGFQSSRETWRTLATSPPNTQAAQAPQSTAEPTATATETVFVVPTTAPGITATLTAAVLPAGTATPAATQPAESGPTAEPTAPPTSPPPAQPTNTPPAVQPPTPAPPSTQPFRVAGPPSGDPNYPSCCYIFGTVRDAAGTGLEGVLVKAFNEWNDLPPAPTKGGGELGQYNIPIGQDNVTWYVVIVDGGGNQISSQAPLNFDPNVAGGFRVDWRRTY
ncbi:MAG: hypothetical protein PVJ23_07555 [Anaerolineae bacterium]